MITKDKLLPASITVDGCIYCRECAAICPRSAIYFQQEQVHILQTLCTNCLLCLPICPVAAFHPVFPGGHLKNDDNQVGGEEG